MCRLQRLGAEELAAFSDIRYIIEDQIAEGDKVLTRWTGRDPPYATTLRVRRLNAPSKLSERGSEQRSERGSGRFEENEMGRKELSRRTVGLRQVLCQMRRAS